MKVVVKTMNRVKKFRKKTYSQIIQKYGFDDHDVYLFVSTQEDLVNYKQEYPNCNVILGPKGIAAIDNFIVDFFEEGDEYIYMNDDVSGIYKMISKTEFAPVKDLKSLLNQVLLEMKKHNLTYGGFYPVCNPFYMHNQKPITHDLKTVMDPLSVVINNKDVKITEIPVEKNDGSLFIGDFSDVEKTIQHYISKGGVVRFNHYSPKVEYYGKQGGIQGRNALTEKVTAEFMKNKYPEYISSVRYKKDGKTSLRLFKKPKIKIHQKPKITKFVISLDDDLGKSRRSKLNYKYQLFKGVLGKDCPEWIKNKMTHRKNISEKAKLGKLGCWASYAKILQKIVDEKIDNSLILEDDCIKIRDFELEHLGNEPIYLNGLFHHPTNYAKRNKKWVKDLKSNIQLNDGINKINYNKYRITGTLGIFIPKSFQAQKILDKLKACKSYTAIDCQLVKNKIIEYFYYPACFRHSDNKKSSISKGYGDIEYFKINELKL